MTCWEWNVSKRSSFFKIKNPDWDVRTRDGKGRGGRRSLTSACQWQSLCGWLSSRKVKRDWCSWKLKKKTPQSLSSTEALSLYPDWVEIRWQQSSWCFPGIQSVFWHSLCVEALPICMLFSRSLWGERRATGSEKECEKKRKQGALFARIGFRAAWEVAHLETET